MAHLIHGGIAGIERPRIVGDSDGGRIGGLYMFHAVSSWTITIVDVRFEGGKPKHILRVHQGLEVQHPKLALRKKNTADSHGSQGRCQLARQG